MKVLHTQRVMNTRPALLGHKGVSTGVALRQRVQQCLGVLQVGRVKTLHEPVVDRGQQLASLGVLALLLPQCNTTIGRVSQLQVYGVGWRLATTPCSGMWPLSTYGPPLPSCLDAQGIAVSAPGSGLWAAFAP